MQRRAMLALLGKTAGAASAWGAGWTRAPFETLSQAITPARTQTTSGTLQQQLQARMAAMAIRTDSELGIPMVLACEDLTAAQPVPPLYSKPMNDVLAPAFLTYVQVWQQMHPEASVEDVGRLAEIASSLEFPGHEQGEGS